MFDDLETSASTTPASPRRSSSGVAGWAVAAAVVLILAVAGGLLTAWWVANSQAVQGPVAAVSPTPAASLSFATPTPAASASVEASEGPRRTPTPFATPDVTPAPFVHVVRPGESLNYIAALYEVEKQDIIDLNEIRNENRIFVGQQLLIPGYGVQPTPKPTKKPR